MRILGLDVGEKRIGVARADTNTRIAIPVETINVDGTEWQEINRLARFYDTTFFVLGMPRSNEGNETAQSLYVRNFSKTLTEKVPGAKIRFQDESLTSVEAEKRLKSRKKNYQKGEIDSEAASIILQDFVEDYREYLPETPHTNYVEKKAEKAMLNSKKTIHKSKKLVTKLLVLPPIFLITILIVLGCLLWVKKSLSPIIADCDKNVCSEIEFSVQDGESVNIIADNLENAGLIRNSFVFKIYQKIARTEVSLKSGTYYISNGLSVSQIIDTLEAGAKDSDVFTFTIAPGENIFTIKNRFKEIGYSSEEIESAFNDNYDVDILKNKPSDASLEGYLFGETYEFFRNESVHNILKTFLTGTDKIVKENDLEAKYDSQGLTLHEGIILASIVQKEAYAADQPTVAQVFLSRLAYNIPLGSDVTVSYAVDLADPNHEIYTDNYTSLQIDSCYNTRKNLGLPCGAISNPGLSALLAVAEPSDTDYLYFLTGDDGTMYYSYTENEHNQNIYLHCQQLCNVSL